MKKTLMTIAVVGFGVSVAFAQTTGTGEGQQETETQNTEYTTQEQQSENLYGQEEEGRRRVEMYELPVAVQDAFKNGQYKDWEVLAVYEVSTETQAEAEGVGASGTSAVDGEGVTYEFELASNETQGEVTTTMEEESGTTTNDGLGNIQKERVSNRQPDLILHFDANGQVLKEESPEEAGEGAGSQIENK